MFTIQLNGAEYRCEDNMTVERLLEVLSMLSHRLVVVVNEEVLLRQEYTTLVLSAGDRVDIVTAVGGG